MADTYTKINCPACGKEMKKIFLAENGFNIDVCDQGCGGIFLDNREFKALDEQHEKLDDYILAVENNKFDIKVDEDAIRICPACGAKMVKNSTSAKGEITIDECYTCGAKFLDHGELTKIRAEYATEQERADAAVRALLYSPEGAQLGLAKTSNRVNRVSMLGNFFTKFMH